MCEACIQNFLNKSDPGWVERHSDSSDFENPSLIPVIAPKDGNHSLLKGKVRKYIAEKDYNKDYLRSENIRNDELIKRTKKFTTKTFNNKSTKSTNVDYIGNRYKKLDYVTKKEDKRNRGDQYYSSSDGNSRSLIKNKILPCLSTILRRPHNKHLHNVDNNHVNTINPNNKFLNSTFNHKHKNKLNKRRYNCAIHPVYTVKDIQGFPLSLNETYDMSQLNDNKTKKISTICLSEYSISTSEEEVKNYKYEKNSLKLKMQSKNNSKEKYNKGENTINKNSIGQQYTFKTRIKRPYQVFASSCQADGSCNTKCTSTESGEGKLEPSSSAFWDFLVDKVCKKYPGQNIENPKACDCVKPPEPCNPQTCENRDNSMLTDNYYEPEYILPRLTPPSARSSKEDKVECQCHSKNRDKITNKSKLKSPSKEVMKPCQEQHDDIARAVAEKYHGEILCIHNPPCILINGCLNMPAPQNVQTHYNCPMTQSKRSNFVQMCRKMKRSKHKNCEQSSQYHPPYTELDQFLPEFRTEKIVQSTCNHNPTCQYVRGCYKPRFNPELTNSCVHVPMCAKLPECVIGGNQLEKQYYCHHDPKCKEVPLCSRKEPVLVIKENIGTQANADTICRHEPPCIRIPTCLAQMICGNHSPFEIIPSCLHNPRCETIPTCIKKFDKENMVSTTSQHPSATCRIV